MNKFLLIFIVLLFLFTYASAAVIDDTLVENHSLSSNNKVFVESKRMNNSSSIEKELVRLKLIERIKSLIKDRVVTGSTITLKAK